MKNVGKHLIKYLLTMFTSKFIPTYEILLVKIVEWHLNWNTLSKSINLSTKQSLAILVIFVARNSSGLIIWLTIEGGIQENIHINVISAIGQVLTVAALFITRKSTTNQCTTFIKRRNMVHSQILATPCLGVSIKNPTHCLWLRPWTRRLYKVLSSNLSCHPLIPTLEVNKLRLNYCKQSILSKIHHSHIYFCYIYYQFCYVYLCMNKNIYNLTIFLGIIKLFSQKERLDTMTYRTLLIVYH